MIGKKWSIKNVLKNWFLILSTMAYAVMQIRLYIPFIISLIGILVAVIVIAGCINGVIIDYCRGKSKYILLYSFFNALGVVFANYKIEWNYYESSFQANNGKIEKLIYFLDIKGDIFNAFIKCFFIIASIISFGVVFLFLIYCSEKILFILRDIRIHNYIRNVCKQEKIIFSMVFFAQMAILIFFFRRSVAGYAGPCDIIYGTDSEIYGNVMGFLHTDILNIRQPLLEVISAPFIGFTFLFTIVPVKNAWIASVLAQLVQIGLLSLANIILIKLLNLDNVKQRILIFLLLSVSYSNLEGILIIEKYIFAYFWLIVYIAWNLSGNNCVGGEIVLLQIF